MTSQNCDRNGATATGGLAVTGGPTVTGGETATDGLMATERRGGMAGVARRLGPDHALIVITIAMAEGTRSVVKVKRATRTGMATNEVLERAGGCSGRGRRTVIDPVPADPARRVNG